MNTFGFLDLVASEYFSNQHSAWFDRVVQTEIQSNFTNLQKTHPSYLFSEFNLFYSTERRLALATNEASYLEWFESRIDLFNKICLPSIESLALKPTCWFLLCDIPQSPAEESLLKLLTNLSDRYTVVTCDFRNANSDADRHYILKNLLIKRCISAHLSNSSYEAIITSRLDTDDCLGSLYFYNLYKYLYLSSRFGSGHIFEDIIVNFPVGAQIVTTDDGQTGLPTHNCKGLIFGENCFTSRVEYGKSPESINTVWSCPHDEVFGVLPVRNLVTQSPAWYQFIHGRNVQNTSVESLYSLNHSGLPAHIKNYLT